MSDERQLDPEFDEFMQTFGGEEEEADEGEDVLEEGGVEDEDETEEEVEEEDDSDDDGSFKVSKNDFLKLMAQNQQLMEVLRAKNTAPEEAVVEETVPEISDEDFEKLTSDPESFRDFMINTTNRVRQQSMMEITPIVHRIVSTMRYVDGFFAAKENEDLADAKATVLGWAQRLENKHPEKSPAEVLEMAASQIRAQFGKGKKRSGPAKGAAPRTQRTKQTKNSPKGSLDNDMLAVFKAARS